MHKKGSGNRAHLARPSRRHDACMTPSIIEHYRSMRRMHCGSVALTSRVREINYIPYVLELSCAAAAYCNLIGTWKFLNGDKLDAYARD